MCDHFPAIRYSLPLSAVRQRSRLRKNSAPNNRLSQQEIVTVKNKSATPYCRQPIFLLT
jgi:hypothetical protein